MRSARPGQNRAEIIFWKNAARMRHARLKKLLRRAVIYLDCRVSPTQRSYPDVITKAFRQFAATVPDLHPEKETNRDLKSLLDFFSNGLKRGAFSDTNSLCANIGQINLALAHVKCLPMVLIVVRAQTEIQEFADYLKRERVIPSAMAISGSPLMLDEVVNKRWLFLAIGVINRLLAAGVPILGICFGGQLLGYMEFGSLPKYHCVPEGVHYEYLMTLDRHVPVTPGAKRPIYGSRPIEALPGGDTRHPIMYGLPRLEALMAHGMGFEMQDRKIPFSQVLAVSKHQFVDRPDNPTVIVEQEIVEVAVSRSAIISLFHPELDPDLLEGLAVLPQFRTWLEECGLEIAHVREEISRHPKGKPWAGEQLLKNFFLRIVGPYHIGRLVDTKIITASEAKELLQRLQDGLVNGGQ